MRAWGRMSPCTRMLTMRDCEVDPAQPPQKWIALCLSGGGLRATFFHLGIIKALIRGKLLGSISEMFSVSAGSILAVLLVSNWSKVRTDPAGPAQFERIVRELGRRDIRGRVIRRWLLTFPTMLLPEKMRRFRLGAIEHLEREYRKVFRAVCLY